VIRQRVISAVVIAMLLIAAVLWLPRWWSAAALSLVLALAAWEWSGFLGAGQAARRAFFLVVTVLAAVLWWRISATAQGLRVTLWLALLFWTVMLLWVFWRPQASRAGVFIVGVLALSLAWCALVRMRVDSLGGHAVMYALLIVWVADSGAYFSGRAWGERKLAPSVSPGKTWAGMWGGLAACALLGLLVAVLAGLPVVPFVAVTVAVGVYSVVGDLVESLCKRFAGLKDSGTLIPGHGGVLDRFDSLLAAAPCLMLGIELSGVVWR
jgi:phosphatidate cytidylyltransferase